MRQFIASLQALPESHRQIILWVAMGVIGLIALILFINSLRGIGSVESDVFSDLPVDALHNRADAIPSLEQPRENSVAEDQAVESVVPDNVERVTEAELLQLLQQESE